MIIELSLQDNYKFHLNNAIKLLSRPLSESELDDYLIGFLSAALALELGLKLAVKDTIDGDIFVRKKNGKIKLSKDGRKITLTIYKINQLIKKNHYKFEQKILNNFSVKIDSTIIDEEIDFIAEVRNNLFHYQGAFDTQLVVPYILKAFIFINILLPNELSMANILMQKEAFLDVLKASSFQFRGILSNVDEILIHQDNYFDINIGGNDTCSQCGYDALISLEDEKGHCYICLLCASHDYFLTCSHCGMELPGDQLAHTDYESNTFLCDSCYDHAHHSWND